MVAATILLVLMVAVLAARSDDDVEGTRIGAIECISHGSVLQMGVRARGKSTTTYSKVAAHPLRSKILLFLSSHTSCPVFEASCYVRAVVVVI
jgi:hypothetical protein